MTMNLVVSCTRDVGSLPAVIHFWQQLRLATAVVSSPIEQEITCSILFSSLRLDSETKYVLTLFTQTFVLHLVGRDINHLVRM